VLVVFGNDVIIFSDKLCAMRGLRGVCYKQQLGK
jgi:hypothetical protein